MCCNSLLSRKTALEHFKTRLGQSRNRFNSRKIAPLSSFPLDDTCLSIILPYLLKITNCCYPAVVNRLCWHSSIQHEPVEVASHHDKVCSVIRDNFAVKWLPSSKSTDIPVRKDSMCCITWTSTLLSEVQPELKELNQKLFVAMLSPSLNKVWALFGDTQARESSVWFRVGVAGHTHVEVIRESSFGISATHSVPAALTNFSQRWPETCKFQTLSQGHTSEFGFFELHKSCPFQKI